MIRYELVSYEAAPPEVQAIYNDYLLATASEKVPIWLQSLGGNVDLLRGYWERTKGSLVCGTLPMVLKEMVIFVVSILNGSRYCSAVHAHAVLSLDPTMQFKNLQSLSTPGDNSQGLPPSFRAALDFAIFVAQNANEVTDEAFERLYDVDFSAEEIQELLSVIDLAMMFNSYSSTLRLPIDPDYCPVLDPLPED